MPQFVNFLSSHPRNRWRAAVVVALLAVGAVCVLLLWRSDLSAPAPASQGGRQSPELLNAEQRANLCTSINAVGVGLRGEYFASETAQGEPLLVRVDSPVDFDASLDWPVHLASRRPQLVRWSGWIKTPLTGTYRFHADAPGLRISVAKQVVAGQGADAGAAIELAAGRFYPIQMELTDIEPGMPRVRLEWTAPHGARYLVPRTLMFLPTESVAATPSG